MTDRWKKGSMIDAARVVMFVTHGWVGGHPSVSHNAFLARSFSARSTRALPRHRDEVRPVAIFVAGSRPRPGSPLADCFALSRSSVV